jgi:hypothetical protein
LAKYHANGDTLDALVLWELSQIRAALAAQKHAQKHAQKLAQQTSYLDFLRTPGNRHRLAVLLSLCVGLNWMGNGIIA